TVTNGSAGAPSGSGKDYTVDITPTGDGLVTVDVTQGAARDAAGNPNNAAAPQLTRTYDHTAPTVTLSSTAPDPTKTSPIPVAITFSEAVTDFTKAGITVTNGSAGAPSGSGKDYTVDITPTGDGLVTVDVTQGAARDAAGNGNSAAAPQLTRTYDHTGPVPTITSNSPDPFSTKSIRVQIRFDESVREFTLDGVRVTNGAPSKFLGSGGSYSVDIAPAAPGLVTVEVKAETCTDFAGNPNVQSSQFSRTFDGTAPRISGTKANQTLDDNKTLLPFRPVTIADSDKDPEHTDQGQAQTVTISLSPAETGSFTASSLLESGFTSSTAGVYSFNGAANIATTSIRKLRFQPVANRRPPEQTETVVFTITVNDAIYPEVSDSTTSVIIKSINDPPQVSDIEKRASEDNDVTFALTDFTAHFTDPEGEPLSKITLTSLPSNGVLKLSGGAIIAPREIPATDLGALVFTPNQNWNGQTGFGWNGHDGTAYAKSPARVTITLDAANDPPVAIDQWITLAEDNPGFTITLGDDVDADGDPLSYQIVAKPAHGALLSAGSSEKIIYRPNRDYAGDDEFAFTVNDGKLDSNTATVSIEVTAVADNPVADAGPDQLVLPGDSVALRGFNSFTPDVNSTLSYSWTQASGANVTIEGASTEQATFTAPQVTSKGASLVFNLTVTDQAGLSSTDRCIVNVSAQNAPPTANPGPDQNVGSGQTVSLDGSGSEDLDSTIASYVWKKVGGPPVVLSDPRAPQPTFTAPAAGIGGKSLSFLLTVKDSQGLQADGLALVNVVGAGNQPPTAGAGADQTVLEGAVVSLNGSGSKDTDDGIASCRWTQVSGPPVKISNPRAAKTWFKAPKIPGLAGFDLVFRLIVTDWAGLQSQSLCTIHVHWVNY
ncbi:MAG: tandem-95 repeat protein, partial [Syntrophobacteraceae bacterium]